MSPKTLYTFNKLLKITHDTEFIHIFSILKVVIFVKFQPPWEAGFSHVFHNVFLDLLQSEQILS